MAALVLGKRSTSCFLEELHHHPASAATPPPPPSPSKRARFGDSLSSFSPSRQSPSSPCSSPKGTSLESPALDGAAGVNSDGSASDRETLICHLRSLFPDMEDLLLGRVLEASGGDLDFSIRSLKEFCSGSAECLQPAMLNSVEGIGAGTLGNSSVVGASENPTSTNNLPADGCEWVNLLVREMMNAIDVDDAKMRASRLLEILEKSILTQASAEVVQTFHKETMMLKEQVEGLLHDNNILKRAVAIQHERQKELDERSQELQHLKQLLAMYQEQLRTLEINNYALSMHLRQAQQGSSIPGRFHPDVF